MDVELMLKKLILSGSKRRDLTNDYIHDTIDLLTDLDFDSISIIQLIVNIEKTFHIEIEDSMLDFETLTTFGNLKQYIAESIEVVQNDK